MPTLCTSYEAESNPCDCYGIRNPANGTDPETFLWKVLMPEQILALLESLTHCSAHDGKIRGGKEEHSQRRMWWKKLTTRIMQIYALGNVGLKTLISGRKKKDKGRCNWISWGNKYVSISGSCLLGWGKKPTSKPEGDRYHDLSHLSSWITTVRCSNLILEISILIFLSLLPQISSIF